MTNQEDQVLIIFTSEVERARSFLEQFGLTFTEEKHGSGPTHYACEKDGKVFELYPAIVGDRVRFISNTPAAK